MRSSLSLAVLSSLTLFAIPTTADANNYWSQSANACVPDHAAINAQEYLVTGGNVKHASPPKLGRVHLNCGVEENAGNSLNPNRLYLAYRDSSGSAVSNTVEVKALFYRQARATYTLTLIATADSDSSAVTSDNEISTGFVHAVDFSTFLYYVEAEFDRAASTDDVIFRGVSLDYAP